MMGMPCAKATTATQTTVLADDRNCFRKKMERDGGVVAMTG